ncbi:helix-turn-helix domain-containing protein [Methylophaga sulfidovorans]|uniref:Helix-turn-helix domain-containing protein n=1 Tax=Methylophaga sulfidovorans TaxID=45496 RepID=A0A1I4C4U5_9GAMM|nr:helix-turn-helix domain-containing protein [Methylophaga sulfidovorans]SFK75339.1 Helix-turn-helix domain-containing protein [Methylophaga sulfidovorans]
MEEFIKLITPQDTAKLLNVKVGTLANWRSMGEGPAYTKIGKSVRYALEDINEFIAKGRVA